nr:hypothetical protein [Tanacetum cinerariifolium]
GRDHAPHPAAQNARLHRESRATAPEGRYVCYLHRALPLAPDAGRADGALRRDYPLHHGGHAATAAGQAE